MLCNGINFRNKYEKTFAVTNRRHTIVFFKKAKAIWLKLEVCIGNEIPWGVCESVLHEAHSS